jgi:hypothetical protein
MLDILKFFYEKWSESSRLGKFAIVLAAVLFIIYSLAQYFEIDKPIKEAGNKKMNEILSPLIGCNGETPFVMGKINFLDKIPSDRSKFRINLKGKEKLCKYIITGDELKPMSLHIAEFNIDTEECRSGEEVHFYFDDNKYQMINNSVSAKVCQEKPEIRIKKGENI